MKKNYLIPETYLIMIVDDEEIIRIISKVILESYGYEVIDYESPLAALEFYKNNYHKIDVVILDLIMPAMDGESLFYKLKEINPYLIACMLSGSIDVKTKYQHLLSDGLYCILNKPINGELISMEIWEMLKCNQTINIEKGLSLIMNHESSYLKLLKVYLEEYEDIEAKIKELLKQDKLLDVDNIIHKIKGIAMNLGAEVLYYKASKLHQQYYDNKFDIKELYDFIKYHTFLTRDIKRILGAQIVQ